MLPKLCAIGLVAACAGTSMGSVWMFNWTRPQPTVGYTDDGGRAINATTMYNDVTGELYYQMTWSDQISDGLSLVLSPGEYPSDAGRFAVLMLDYTDTGDIKGNVFAYNASNDPKSSIIDGTDHIAGNQAPDKILSTESGDTSWFTGATIDDAFGMRTLSLSINTNLINAHSPLYDGRFGPVDWLGMQYGAEMGIWAHSFAGLTTNYAADGFLDQWDADAEGFFDGTFIPTTDITPPAPGTAALLAFGGIAASRRRR
ncbi:MAG: hypothetical protein RIB32_00655 [Phycisphaerales bacterium]